MKLIQIKEELIKEIKSTFDTEELVTLLDKYKKGLIKIHLGNRPPESTLKGIDNYSIKFEKYVQRELDWSELQEELKVAKEALRLSIKAAKKELIEEYEKKGIVVEGMREKHLK